MKKALSFVLVLVMLLGMMPMTAFATDADHTHTYTATVTAPTCTEQGYTTYTCECGDSYVRDYVDATDHTYENGTCLSCGRDDTTVELFGGFSAIDFFLKDGVLSDGQEHVVAIYSNTNNARMAVIPIQEGATYYIRIKNNDQDSTKRMRICTFAENFSSLVISPLASERNMAALDPNVVSVAQDVIFWDPNKGEDCVSEYEGVFVNTGNAKTLVLFTAWGADPSLVDVSVKGENHIPESHPLDNMDEMIHILTENVNQENQATRDIMQIAQVFWEHRDEFIYCSGTALDQPWNYWSYTGYVDSANTGKTITAENAGYKRIDCSTFVRYVINGFDYYSTPYYNALETTQVEQGGLDAGVDVTNEDPTVCRTGKMYIRDGKKLILEAKSSDYTFTKVFGYDASGKAIQTLENTATNTVFVPDEGVVYLRAEMKVTDESDYASASAGIPAAILKCLRIREDERLEINAECPYSGYRNANQICKWFDENGYAVEINKESFNLDNLRVGSVIYWGRTSGTWAYKNITHTSIYIGDGYVMHVSAPYGLLGGEGILIEAIDVLMERYDIPLVAVSSPKYHMADIHPHSYEADITAPTCTEQGYTTYTCECGDSYVDDYVDATGHTYENGICTGCGTEHPNLANYKGKVISILGDSISTFAGYIPTADGFNLKHYARYPQDNLFTEVEHTWWMQVLTALDAKLGINESWRSTEVYNYIDAEVNSSYDGTKACMASTTRIQNLGSNGIPDVILFYGGTNDITQRRPVGNFDPDKAPAEVDLVSVKWDTVADSYVDAIMRMQHYYPNAEIVAMLPTFTYKNTDAVIEEYNSVFAAICEHYGVTCVDLRECGISIADLPDGTHPNAEGMDYITAAVMDVLLTNCNVAEGDHIVHSVTHNLTGAESSLGYYKGVSHGSSFTAVITGDNLNVTVTMAGTDITADCYANGVISIKNVTGDIIVIAEGNEKTVYEDYLQELPKEFCVGTNLWTVLEPINLYYTASGWGLNVSGSAYSVTIPISAGDQLWATSFQKSGINGGNGNGIRLTWFDGKGVLKTLSPSGTYAEFLKNGYLTAPENAVAVNVVMWNGDESNELYILNRDHTYENGICTGCGEDTVVAELEGNTLTLSGELEEGTRIFAAGYDSDGRFSGVKEFVWQGEPLSEELPVWETVKLFFPDENGLPLRKSITLN